MEEGGARCCIGGVCSQQLVTARAFTHTRVRDHLPDVQLIKSNAKTLKAIVAREEPAKMSAMAKSMQWWLTKQYKRWYFFYLF